MVFPLSVHRRTGSGEDQGNSAAKYPGDCRQECPYIRFSSAEGELHLLYGAGRSKYTSLRLGANVTLKRERSLFPILG